MLREVGAITAKVGDPLPDIALPSTRGRPLSPAEFRGKDHVILFFYPGNGNPHPELAGCTKEACALRDVMSSIRGMKGQVLGVSRQGPEEQMAFAKENSLEFPLLSDAGGRLGGALGVPEIRTGSEVYWKRVTFVADRHGNLKKVFPAVNPERHAEEILAVLVDLNRRP